jgi:guanylate kinase
VVALLISITGPSGAGKDYVKKGIIKHYPFIRELTWITTRPLRNGELINSNRKTVSANEFLEYWKQKRLIIDQELFGHYYGLEKEVFLEAIGHADIFWTEFHIDSLIRICESGFRLVSIALVPLDVALLGRRLKSRDHSNVKEIKERTAAARDEVDRIYRHQELFLKMIEVCEEAEDKVVPQVIEALKPFFDKSGH